jgi:hypothetical protein
MAGRKTLGMHQHQHLNPQHRSELGIGNEGTGIGECESLRSAYLDLNR